MCVNIGFREMAQIMFEREPKAQKFRPLPAKPEAAKPEPVEASDLAVPDFEKEKELQPA